jgi:triosephosphate isomerase
MKVKVGSQGVFRDDVEKGRNFGAFTTFLPSTAATSLGATQALIGHTEERANLLYIITMGKGSDVSAMHNILNQEVQCAIKSGMKVLFCVGEKTEEQPRRFEVLKEQLEIGLHNVDLSKVVVAYEPVWAIGNNKPIPTKEYISEIVSFIKSVVNVDVVYGGGLKVDNASMLASIPLLDGGLIGLTEFGEHFGFSTKGYLEIVNTYREAVIQHQNVEELE